MWFVNEQISLHFFLIRITCALDYPLSILNRLCFLKLHRIFFNTSAESDSTGLKPIVLPASA